MLNEVCAYLKNWFDVDDDRHPLPSWQGEFEISDGAIDLTGKVAEGQYYRIQNSIFNDGVHLYPAAELTDEAFTGKIQAMAVPKDLLKIVGEMEKWVEKYGGADSAALSPYNSESFAGYSYSKSSGGGSNVSSQPLWAGAFAGRLARWRKL